MRRDKQTVIIESTTIDNDMSGLTAWLNEHGYGLDLKERFDRIDRDHQQIKTRLTDDEKDDQKAKRVARSRKANGKVTS